MSTKKSQYHVAINSQGYLLAGSPIRPARTMQDAPKYGENPTIDAEYSDASQLFPWAQTDWSGNFQKEKWEDSASFKTGVNVDVLDKFGEIKLQHAVSAVKTNFADGHTFGSAIVANNNLVIGTLHATLAHLWYFNSSDSASQVTTSWTLINQVNDMAVYRDKVLLALKRTGGAEYTLQSYNFTAMANVRDTSTEVRAVEVIEDRIWEAELNSTANGDRLIYSDDGGSNWTTSITATGQNRQIIKMEKNYGILYFLIQDGIKVEFWKVTNTTVEFIYGFDYLSTPNLKSYLGCVFISGKDEKGNVIIYRWTGSQLTTSFYQTLDTLTASPNQMVEYKGNLILHGLAFDGEVWSPHITASISGGSTLIPFITFGSTSAGNLYFYGTDSGSDLDIYKLNSSAYATTGLLTTGAFYGYKQAINKLWTSITINCAALAAGEQIQVEYSIDQESTWTSLGTLNFTNDGAITSKILTFGNNITSRHISLRFTLTAGTSQATTPIMYDFVCRFKPIAEERYIWQLRVKCIEAMLLLDGESREPKDSIELRNLLLVAKETKATVDFEDIDFFETQLNGALTATATTVTLKSVANLPKQGRLKIGTEWIIYTGRSDTGITGCTRGARGTTAASHSDGDTVSNLYQVLVKKMQEELRVSNEPQGSELYVTVVLEEI